MTEDTKKAACPISGPMADKFCALPVDRQWMAAMGVVVLVLSLLAMVIEGFIWLVAILGGVMIYAGMTGNCPLRKKLMSWKGGDCGTGKGSCGS